MLHIDEAREKALARLEQLLSAAPGSRAVLIEDLFGRFRVVAWAPDDLRAAMVAAMQDEAGQYWSGEIWNAGQAQGADRALYDEAWEGGREIVAGGLRVLDRHRNRGSWFAPSLEPVWPAPQRPDPESPVVAVFYSFKGGVGRTTALAAFAVHRARLGERVAVIDADLDAPGIGKLLAADAEGLTARWGVADYLIERQLGAVNLLDYYHACRRETITGRGEIFVVPASRIDENYVGKLARVDLEPPGREGTHPLESLLLDVKADLRPSWILLDARAGLSEIGGWLLGGLAHLHVLFGTSSEQSWAGLRVVIDRLGASRLRQGLPQADCLLVQTMVPPSPEVSARVRAAFEERARDEFVDIFYAAEPASDAEPVDEDVWYVSDAESGDAPHVPVVIHYSEVMAYFKDLGEVVDAMLENADYRRLCERIGGRFAVEISDDQAE